MREPLVAWPSGGLKGVADNKFGGAKGFVGTQDQEVKDKKQLVKDIEGGVGVGAKERKDLKEKYIQTLKAQGEGQKKRGAIVGGVIGGAAGLLGGAPGGKIGMALGGAIGGALGGRANATSKDVFEDIQKGKIKEVKDAEKKENSLKEKMKKVEEKDGKETDEYKGLEKELEEAEGETKKLREALGRETAAVKAETEASKKGDKPRGIIGGAWKAFTAPGPSLESLAGVQTEQEARTVEARRVAAETARIETDIANMEASMKREIASQPKASDVVSDPTRTKELEDSMQRVADIRSQTDQLIQQLASLSAPAPSTVTPAPGASPATPPPAPPAGSSTPKPGSTSGTTAPGGTAP